MDLPTVAIVGRPNVGKSSLFNALVKTRLAIVDPTAGVTRDRVSMILRAGSRRCELIDTGGIGIVDKQGLAEDIEAQIDVAMHEADLILFVVDVQTGVTGGDQEVARRLRKIDKKVFLIANKADGPSLETEAAAFYQLGFEDPIPVAAQTGRGIGELRDRIGEEVPEPGQESEDDSGAIRIAIVGRTNAGKSTLVNRLLGQARMIVSATPGTTRDAVDLPFEWNGHKFVAVDTAGMRKKKSISGSPDFYGQARSERAIRRAHVVLFLIDATEPVGRVEKSIGQKIQQFYRPALVALSKWDLVQGERTLEEYTEYLEQELGMLKMAPLTCFSAAEEFHLAESLELVRELHEQSRQRMTTGEINRLVKGAIEQKGPPSRGGRTGKVFFAAQVDTSPPTIVLFVNESKLMTNDYQRYLMRYIRERSPFPEVPIRLWIRQREDKKRKR